MVDVLGKEKNRSGTIHLEAGKGINWIIIGAGETDLNLEDVRRLEEEIAGAHAC